VVPYSLETARALFDILALLLLGSAVSLVLIRRLDTMIYLLAGQGVLLAFAAIVIALATGTSHAYAAVVLTIVVKILAVPAILLHALREVNQKQEVELVMPQRLAFILGTGLVLVAYDVAGSLPIVNGLFTRNMLPAALSMMLIGLFTMLIRKKALSQVAGLVAMENGLFLAAIVATKGLPLAVELGIAIDVLVGVVVMGFFSRLIHRAHGTINTDTLRSLKG
jgi:hydrogenase-4 component E